MSIAIFIIGAFLALVLGPTIGGNAHVKFLRTGNDGAVGVFAGIGIIILGFVLVIVGLSLGAAGG